MPLYEYQCEACGHRFETIQKFSDSPVEQCPKCGGAVRKLVASPAFQFKGSGWYVTDYAKKDNASATGKAAEETKDSGVSTPAKDAPKTDSTTSSSPSPAETTPKAKD